MQPTPEADLVASAHTLTLSLRPSPAGEGIVQSARPGVAPAMGGTAPSVMSPDHVPASGEAMTVHATRSVTFDHDALPNELWTVVAEQLSPQTLTNFACSGRRMLQIAEPSFRAHSFDRTFRPMATNGLTTAQLRTLLTDPGASDYQQLSGAARRERRLALVHAAMSSGEGRAEMMRELRTQLPSKQVTLLAARCVRKPGDLVWVTGSGNEHIGDLSRREWREVLTVLVGRSGIMKPAPRRQAMLQRVRDLNLQAGGLGMKDLELAIGTAPDGTLPARSGKLLREYLVRSGEQTEWPMSQKDMLVQDGLSGTTRRLGHFAYWLACNGEDALPSVMNRSKHERWDLLHRYCHDASDISVAQMEQHMAQLAQHVAPVTTAAELGQILSAAPFPEASFRWPGHVTRQRQLLEVLADHADRMNHAEREASIAALKTANDQLDPKDRIRLP